MHAPNESELAELVRECKRLGVGPGTLWEMLPDRRDDGPSISLPDASRWTRLAGYPELATI